MFHLLTVPLVWAFGPQLWTGRLVSFTASLVAAGAIAYGVARAGGSRAIGVLAGLTFLASNDVFHIGPLFRQHMTMVGFETLAVVCLAQLDSRPGSSWLRRPAFWLGLVFLLAAGYTKQLAAATVVAGLAFLFIRGPRRALLAGLGLAVAAGAIFGLINLATGGYWYLSHHPRQHQRLRLDPGAAALSPVARPALAHRGGGRRRLGVRNLLGAALGLWHLVRGWRWPMRPCRASLARASLTSSRPRPRPARCRAWPWRGCGAWLPAWGRATARWPRAAAVGTAALALAIPLLYLVQARLTLHLPTTGPIYGPAARVLGVADRLGLL